MPPRWSTAGVLSHRSHERLIFSGARRPDHCRNNWRFDVASRGLEALVQTDIKRALAYSPIQPDRFTCFWRLAWALGTPAIFHFMTHASSNALLFLAAGAIILSLHHEQDIFKMGGLRRSLRVCSGRFLIGSASLAAIAVRHRWIL